MPCESWKLIASLCTWCQMELMPFLGLSLSPSQNGLSLLFPLKTDHFGLNQKIVTFVKWYFQPEILFRYCDKRVSCMFTTLWCIFVDLTKYALWKASSLKMHRNAVNVRVNRMRQLVFNKHFQTNLKLTCGATKNYY